MVTGYLTNRIGFDGKSPTMSSDPGTGWEGPIAESDRPMIARPEGGALFTANGRTIRFPKSRTVTTAWESPARAARIRDLLASSEAHDETSLAKLQLDTRNALLDPYLSLIREAAERRGNHDAVVAADN